MKKVFLFIMLPYWVIGGFADAQSLSGNLGTSWLKIEPSTRNAAMGDSVEALPDAFDEADLNPAVLGLIGGSYISLSQNFWAQGLSAQHLIFTQSLSNDDAFSFGANYINFGNISTYNVVGNVLTANGNYSPIGFNLYGAYGLGLGNGFRAGLTGHFIFDDIQQNFPDKTVAFDAGLFFQPFQDPLYLSAVMSNLGWNIDDTTLPLEFKTSAAYQMGFGDDLKKASNLLNLSVEADWYLNDGNYHQLGLGAEYWYKNLIALRAGYQFTNIGDLTGLTWLTLGAGIKYGDWQLDYALVTLGELGVANQIGLSLKLGDNKPTPTATPTSTPTNTLTNTPTPTPTIIQTMTPTTVPLSDQVGSIFGGTQGDSWSLSDNCLAIYADFKSKDPRGKDLELLDKLVTFLLANPNLRITINGHTDNKGPKKLNDRLSLDRALTAEKYLIQKGFPAQNILEAKGHGDTEPLADNSTDEGRAKNRRTVICWIAASPVSQESITPTPALNMTGNSLTVYADFKSTLPHEKDVEALSQLAEFLLANPDLKVTIDGYADEMGPKEVNLNASVARAAQVRNYLIQKGVSAQAILWAKGHGDASPVADNSTDEGRAMNRRVVLQWVPSDQTASLSAQDTSGTLVPDENDEVPVEAPQVSIVSAKKWWGDNFDAQSAYDRLIDVIVPALVNGHKLILLGDHRQLFFDEARKQGMERRKYINMVSGYYTAVAKNLIHLGDAKDADFYLNLALFYQAYNLDALKLQPEAPLTK